MSKFKRIIKNKRVIILIVSLILAVYLIHPSLSEGVAIRGVTRDSAAAQAVPHPIMTPTANLKPTSREIIENIDGMPIKTLNDYFTATSNLTINQTITIKTNYDTYLLTVLPLINKTVTNQTEQVLVNKTIFNETTNKSQTVEVYETKNKTITQVIGPADIGLSVYEKPKNNIKQGLDLEGGTRVLLQPDGPIKADDLATVVESIKQRLDVYGVNDVTVRPTKDFFGNTFISVEIAGVNEEEIKALLTHQGKFEAKIGDQVVFTGGNKDILNVCRSPSCSQVDSTTCSVIGDGQYSCNFWFQITLSQKAADKQAEITRNLGVIPGVGGGYLTENLSLILDGQLVDQLTISSGLKGKAETHIRIQGSGNGTTEGEAHDAAVDDMRKLQTVLITGSLPVKLHIAKTDTISPLLGAGFIGNAIFVGLLAILAVVLVVGIRYREWKIAVPMIVTMLSEVVILLGFAAFIGWRIDMVAIAAIIIAVGSGVDDQIVITDETISKAHKHESTDWKTRLKKAFFIIMASYFTLVVAMVPLMFAGAGLLLGFAITTIAGVTIGVLITRPTFGAVLEILLEK